MGRTPAYTRKYKTIKVCNNALAAAPRTPASARAGAGAALSPDPVCHLVTQSWLEELQPGSPGRIDAVVVMMNMDLFNNLYKDRTAFGGMTADNVVKAALAHELGHGLGLAHAGFYAVPSESGRPTRSWTTRRTSPSSSTRPSPTTSTR